jgi:hypothetical protein
MDKDAEGIGKGAIRELGISVWIARPWLSYCLILGLYLALRGYHSLDGDQTYRLPLLLHRLDPALYADDPFVQAFDVFNPHRGYLAVLGAVVALVGLSTGLLAIFVATFLTTSRAIDRLASSVWPQLRWPVGLLAVVLVFAAKAGNIGTNHLFEAMVLDRLMALALGWQALAECVGRPDRGWWRAAASLCLATIIHPSLGLQLALVVSGAWIVWGLLPASTGVSWPTALKGITGAALSVLPGLALNVGSSRTLMAGLPPDDLWTLAVELQSPQHMLPELWRMPQWLAWGCYLVLAALALGGAYRARLSEQRASPDPPGWPAARTRLVLLLGVILLGLAAAWVAIERFHDLRITLFQPFRMATVARGVALVLIAGRLLALWERRDWPSRLRAVLIAVALTGDWMLVVVTLAELSATVVENLWDKIPILSRLEARDSLEWPFSLTRLESWPTESALPSGLAHAGVLVYGCWFLSRHDTESGHWPILIVVLGGVLAWFLEARGYRFRNPLTPRLALAAAWTLPVLALLAGWIPVDHPLGRTALVRGLVTRCRFTAVPVDDMERLGLWCREHTIPSARFIGPPGPKTFRLWSRRTLAFSRAASPYHAAALADWFARFQDHVDLKVSRTEFVRRYIAGRHTIEERYDEMSPDRLVALALRQGADHVVALAPSAAARHSSSGPLEHLHTEGRYAVYRVSPEQLAQRQR